MGKKYIIELEDKPFNKGNIDFLYRVKGFNSLVFDMTGIDKLTPYTEPDTEKVREEAYKRGREDAIDAISSKEQSIADKAYQSGLSDAWKAARKIAISEKSGGLTCREMQRIFCTDETDEIFDMSASEAIEKIRQYEQESEEIHLGDEVTFLPNNAKGIVSECHVPDVYSDNDKYAVWCGGTMEYVLKQHLTKTGRTFPEIAEVLAKMKEES